MTDERKDQEEIRRLRAEVARLRESPAEAGVDQSLHMLFDNLFEGVQIIDRDFRYHYVNRTAAAHGRRTREDLVGQRMVDIYPGIDKTVVYDLISRCMSTGTHEAMLNQFVFPDGQTAWFDLRLNPVDLGVMIFSIDVSREHEMTVEVARSRENLATTLNCMADAVITTDIAGHVLGVNPAAEAMLNTEATAAMGRPLTSLVHIRKRGRDTDPHDPVRGLLTGEIPAGSLGEIDLEDGRGRRIAVVGSGAPLRGGDGTTSGVVLALRDVTAELELTRRLGQSQRLESVGRLAGGIAHDFNNMLTVIQGYCNMALEDAPGGEVGEGLQEINRAADRAARLTQQLLAFSRRQMLKPEVLDLNLVVADLDRMLRRTLGEDIDLVTRLAADLGHVEADPGQVEQIVVNLALNARDAMPTGGMLTIETANAELDADYARGHADITPGPHVMLAVSDTGVGIAPEVLAQIFEPFFSTKELGKGTGLGLATVYGVVKQSGGNIWAYSEPGLGSTFKIYLPRTEAEVLVRESEFGDQDDLQGTETVLVVEDEPSVRSLIRRVLARSGYQVLSAADADEALDICAQRGRDIDLMLTDVVLPGQGGPELAEQVAASWPAVRVVFMSGYTDRAIVHRGVLDPGTAFIAKPVRPIELLRRLRTYLDAPPPQRPS